MKKRKKINRKYLLLPIVIASTIALVFGGFLVFKKINNTEPTQPEAKTTSTAPSAQEDFTGGSERQENRPSKNEGQIEDTSGNIAAVPNQDQWSISADGAITVYSPAKNSVTKSDDLLSGSSSLSKIYYRLIDDVSGVIAQGSLSVINGKFSGTFSFSTTGSTGRLDIYNANADGIESSNVEIPIRFK